MAMVLIIDAEGRWRWLLLIDGFIVRCRWGDGSNGVVQVMALIDVDGSNGEE